jgi:amino acid adenylation domain-containing protein
MKVLELLSGLEAQGIQLWEENDELRYSSPKGAMTAELKEAIRQHRKEIVKSLQAKKERAEDQRSIPPVATAEHYALSNAQQRLWILSQMEDGSPAYNIPLHVLLEGELDIGFLEKAFQEVVCRHESLRTTFTSVDGEPKQIVRDPDAYRLPVLDLSNRKDPQAEARTMAAAESARVFDLEAGPLFRAQLLRITPLRHLLLCTMHHIVSDGVSIGVFFGEIAAIYNAQRRHAPHALPELPIQYRDYAAWQSEQLESSDTAVHGDYWRDKLRGAIPVLDLPTDAARPPVQTFRGGEIVFSLGAERSVGLRRMARESQASLFMVLLTCVKALLHRYTGAKDVIVGSPVAGRYHPDLQGQIGLYLNTLAIRTFPVSAMTFSDLLAQVRRTCLEAFEHQHYPFDRLVGDLRVERDLSRSPVFDVMMILQNQNDAPPAFEEIQSGFLVEHTGTSKVDITFCCKDLGDEIWVNLEYSTDLFREDRMRRMADHFTELVDNALRDPAKSIGHLGYLTESEETLLLETWNATGMDYPRERTVVDLVDESARRFGDRVAVVAQDRCLTYREIEEESNRLAHYLLGRDVRQGDLIGLCIDRTADMVVALLAILKAGAGYVPLDPTYPAGRIQYILDDAEVKCLLTTSAVWGPLATVCASGEYATINLDQERHAIESQPPGRPPVTVKPAHVCYTIYTSGSTGQPKGVVVPHRALVNFLWSMATTPGLSEEDVLLAVTTLAFDIAALELFLPLVKGARLLIAPRSAISDAVSLQELLESGSVTVMQATPATWSMLLEAGWKGRPGLKILCGGEALPSKLAGRLLDKGSELWNMYGPTETTIWSTVYRIDRGQAAVTSEDDDAVPVGRPIGNTEVYILDAGLRPVPIGVPGDLYIGGDGLALGYHGRPELTAARFVEHPFSAKPKDRLYHTGDLALFRPDGNIEFLGRSDQQVKIRGFRIETGEVEAALTGHPGIQQAVVVTAAEVGGGKRLVAYLVGETVPAGELRECARQRLPEYMIPSLFLYLDSLPLTPSRKVDRAALPEPDPDGAERAAAYTAPRDEVEAAIARVWQDVLGATRIGIHDDFFELGGHSLMATKSIFRLQREAGLSLQLIDLFRSPTIERLAEAARNRIEGSETTGDGGTRELTDDVVDGQDADIAEMTAEERALLDDLVRKPWVN